MSELPDAEAQIARARALLDLSRHEEAGSLLRRVLADDPDQASAWRLLAQAQIDADQDAEALRSARRACALTPDDPWAHRIRSFAASGLGQHPEAVEAARRALALAPGTWQFHARLASALSYEGADPDNWAEADAAVEQAVTLSAGHPYAHFTAGTVAMHWGLLGCAEDSFRRTLTLDPEHGAARNELARLRLLETRRDSGSSLAQAAETFASAVRADPRDRIARDNFSGLLRAAMARIATQLFLAVLSHWLIGPGHTPFPPETGRWLPLLVLAVPFAAIARFLSTLSSGTRRVVARELTRGSPGLASTFLGTAVLLVLAALWLSQTSASDIHATAGTLVLLARAILRGEPLPALPGTRRAGHLRRWARTWCRAGREAFAGLVDSHSGRHVAVLRTLWLAFLLTAVWVILPDGYGWPLLALGGFWLGLWLRHALPGGRGAS